MFIYKNPGILAYYARVLNCVNGFHRFIFSSCTSVFVSCARTFHLFAMILQGIKLIISAVFLKQLMMIALFNDFSV